ncbi:mucin-4-like [Belonocnema kinseyi]|uniref:mucin-4-like n=1 Tax=Belonocnema kinseyi TaxID=2817044 RepID=UPI00143D9A49|nr:mucin-4-like [Belonocnema kinseyi]
MKDRKDKLKAKTWERDRRQRMDTCYKTLADLLPPHQEGRKRNKVEILLHATKYIRELHNRTDELFCARGTTAHKEELARLKKLVTQLLSYIELLSSLLKDAGITVPDEPALEKISPKLWSNKITTDVTERYIKDQSKKDEKIKQRNQLRSSSKKNSNSTPKSSEKSSVRKCFVENDKDTIENQENCANETSNKQDSKGINKSTSSTLSVQQQEDMAVTSATDNVSSAKKATKRRNPKRGKKENVDNKKLSTNETISNLPARALVFSGTKLMPVVTPMPQIASNIVVNQHQSTNPFIFNNGQQSQMIVNQHSATSPIILSNTQQNQMLMNQHQHANSIILNNAQQNQMIVVHPLQTNQVPNSVISLQNRAVVTAVRNIIPSVPKISRLSSLSKLANVQTLPKGVTRDDIASLKSIADTSRIGGHKAILPKSAFTKAITKTTMTYKVPIPAIRKEKVEKIVETKEMEREERSKGKSSKTRQQKSFEKEKNEDASADKVSLKRSASSDKTKEPEDKKRKKENAENEKSVQVKITSIVEIPSSCKTIGNIKQMVEDIERDSEKKQNEVPASAENRSGNKNIESDMISMTIANVKSADSLKSSGELIKETSEIENKSKTGNQSQNLEESVEPSNHASILEEAINITAEVLAVKETTSSLSESSMKAVDDQTIEEAIITERSNEVCDLDAGFGNLLQNTVESGISDEGAATDNKILLNLDTNITTTMELVSNESVNPDPPTSESLPLPKQNETLRESPETSKEEELKTLSYNSSNGFIPISSKSETLHADLSNDIFASLQVPSSSHNPESISPTAAFLMAFPLVSSLSGKTEVLEEEMKEDFKYQSQTPPMLLQIGAMEPNSFKIKSSLENISESVKVKKTEEKSSVETMKPLPKTIDTETLKEPFKIPSIIDHLATRTLTDVANSFPENTITNISSATVSSADIINNSNPMVNINESSLISDVSASEKNDYANQVKPQSNLNYSATPKSDILTTSSCTTLSTSAKGLNSTKYDSTPRYLVSQVSQTESTKDSSIRNPHYEFQSDVTTSNASAFNPSEPEESFMTSNKVAIFSSASEVTERIPPVEKLQTLTSSLEQKDKMETQSLNSLNQISQSSQHVQKITEAIQINLESYNTRDSDTFNTMLAQSCPSKITHPITANQAGKILPTLAGSQNTNNRENHNCKSAIYNPTSISFDTRSIYHSSAEPFSNSSENHRICALGKVMSTIQSETPSQKSSNEMYSTKKVETNQLEQNVSYECSDKSKNTLLDTKKTNPNNTEPDIRNNIYQRKEEPSPYIIPYEKSGKKMVTSEANILNDKVTSIPNSYPQQQQSFIATSNYEESALSRTQSTTTVAHNTSNFSILSWTTFSPASGGNNQFEQGNQSETSQKTICENFNYLPIHKEGFANTIPAPPYPELQSSGFDKSRAKQSLEMQKRSYLDASKSRNVRSIPVSQKQSRSQTQSQIQPQSQSQNQNPVPNSEYKYESDKNKIKYSADLDYIQNNYGGIDTRQQQHGSKALSQTIPPPKQDKTNYMMPDYGIQTHFDPESQQTRYNAEIYNSNFKYVEKPQHQQKYQPSSQANILHDNTSYNSGNKQGQQQQQSSIKAKPQHQQLQQQHPVRAPVNWMMTPEIKHNSNITDIILPPIGKELDFCQNNLFSQTPTYNQSTSNQFYNNYDVTPHGFPNLPVLPSDPKRAMEPTFYPEEQPFSWSPTKNIAQNVEQNQALKSIDHQVVPSTLPTLVGDLALGTNLPDKQNFLFGQMPIRGSNNEQTKDPSKEKEPGREFQTMLNTQNVQHAAQGMSFLSVSQLVEHEKAEKSQHPLHNQQQQPRKHQRKSNTSPRNSAKRQIDIRKQPPNEQLQRHEEHKPTSFADQNYQQQPKYQQNDNHWRSRNCKSNYTAEALISTNNSVDTSNHDKNSAKYANYGQNKFPGSLSSTDPMMPINYFPSVDDTSGYGQVNQNFNHSYGYSSNANIYPTTNFITSISNTPTNYMMSLHENSDYLEANNFLLPPTSSNITTPALANMSSNSKNHQHIAVSKHQNCDKRLYPSVQKKGKRKTDGTVQNFEFPLSGITSPLDEYHHTTHFLPPHANPLYQNHPQANVYPKAMNALAPPPPPLPPAPPPSPAPSSSLPPPIVSGSQGIPSTGIPSSNPMAMGHHPSGTSLINFNLSTIFPEMNDKNCYKSSANDIPPGLVQSSSHAPTSYPQRSSYTNSLVHMTQVSEAMQFTSDVPRPPLSGVVHYKNP